MTRRTGARPRRRLVRAAAGTLAAASLLILAGCDGRSVTSPSLAPTGAAGSVGPTIGRPTVAGDAPIVDLTLLEALPAEIAGLALTPTPEAAAGVIADPTLASWIGSVAYAVAADPASGDTVIAAVVGVRPGQFSDLAYRGYRDTFDPAVCARAGDKVVNAQTVIGGRVVEIATCADGVTIHHAHLTDPDRIVSVTSIGPSRLGEQLIGALRG